MDNYYFIQQLIGLARDHHRDAKKLKRLLGKSTNKALTEAEIRTKILDEFGNDFATQMILTGYFDEESSVEFGKALQKVLETSFPTRKKKT